jgi:hypothetical protein
MGLLSDVGCSPQSGAAGKKGRVPAGNRRSDGLYRDGAELPRRG